MNYQQPQDRWDSLTLCLAFDCQYEKTFTAFERMYIHHERAKLLRDERFEQPLELEQKIENTLTRIKQINWEPYKN